MIEVVLRRTRRVIRVRVVEPNQFAIELADALFGEPVIGRADQEAAPWSFFRHVRQLHGRKYAITAAHESPTALVRIGLHPVPANGFVDLSGER